MTWRILPEHCWKNQKWWVIIQHHHMSRRAALSRRYILVPRMRQPVKRVHRCAGGWCTDWGGLHLSTCILIRRVELRLAHARLKTGVTTVNMKKHKMQGCDIEAVDGWPNHKTHSLLHPPMGVQGGSHPCWPFTTASRPHPCKESTKFVCMRCRFVYTYFASFQPVSGSFTHRSNPAYLWGELSSSGHWGPHLWHTFCHIFCTGRCLACPAGICTSSGGRGSLPSLCWYKCRGHLGRDTPLQNEKSNLFTPGNYYI